MNEKKFEKMLRTAFKEHGDDLIDIKEEWNEPHEFSPLFESKMDKLIRQRKKPVFRVSRKFLQPAVALACAFTIMFSPYNIFTTDADVSMIANIIVMPCGYFNKLIAVDADKAPQTVEDIYAITYVGFDYTDYGLAPDERRYDYRYVETPDNDGYSRIELTQYTKNGDGLSRLTLNTYEAVITTEKINDNEAIFFQDKNGDYWAIWDNGDYIFKLFGDTDKETFIKIAESVQKVGREDWSYFNDDYFDGE